MSNSALSWKLWWSQPQSKYTVMVVAFMVFLAIISRWSCNTKTKYSKNFTRQLKRVVQQASKWHTTAQQDMDPVVNLVHADYALAYANVARAMAPDADVESITGIKLRELIYFLEQDQKKAMQLVVNRCPQLKPSGIYATGNAWM